MFSRTICRQRVILRGILSSTTLTVSKHEGGGTRTLAKAVFHNTGDARVFISSKCFSTLIDNSDDYFPGAANSKDLKVIKNHPAYRDITYNYDPQVVKQTVVHPSAVDFVTLSLSSPDAIYHPKYKLVIDALHAAVKELSEQELIHVFYHIKFFPRRGAFDSELSSKDAKAKFDKVWIPLDEEFVLRGVKRKDWRAAINYVIADVISHASLSKLSTFHWIFVKISFRKVDSLLRPRFVRLCFGINKTKTFPKDMKMYPLEYNIQRVIEKSEQNDFTDITPEELSVICQTFYKLKAPFHDKQVVSDILDVCVRNSKTISSSSLSSICQACSIARGLQIQEPVTNFFNIIIPEIPRLDILAYAGILFLAVKARVRNNDLLLAIENQIELKTPEFVNSFHAHHVRWLVNGFEELGQPSSKAFKLIYSLMKECAKNSNKFSKAQENNACPEQSEEENLEDAIVNVFEKQLPPILTSLSSGGVHPMSLISKTLSPKNLNDKFGKKMFGYPFEILLLDQRVAAELKNYSGNRLTENAIHYMSKKFMHWVPTENQIKLKGHSLFCKIMENLISNLFGGPSFIYLCNLLPYTRSYDIVFCTDKEGVIVPVPESFKMKEQFVRKTLSPEDFPEEGIKYHAIQLQYWDHMIHGTDEPLGSRLHATKIAQKMGFTTYNLSHTVWRDLETVSKQYEYITKVLTKGGLKLPDIASQSFDTGVVSN